MTFWTRLVRRLTWSRRATRASDAELARRRRLALMALRTERRHHEPPSPLDPFSGTPVRNPSNRPPQPSLAAAVPEPDDDRESVEAVGAGR